MKNMNAIVSMNLIGASPVECDCLRGVASLVVALRGSM
jgi:hypothetical protein